MKWTEDETQTLRKLVAEGKDDTTVAAHFTDRTRHAIENKLVAMGLKRRSSRASPRKFSIAENREIMRRHEAGERITDLAIAFGVSRSVMNNKLIYMRKNERSSFAEETSRRCLGGCGQWFLSKWPPSVERICPQCVRTLAL